MPYKMIRNVKIIIRNVKNQNLVLWKWNVQYLFYLYTHFYKYKICQQINCNNGENCRVDYNQFWIGNIHFCHAIKYLSIMIRVGIKMMWVPIYVYNIFIFISMLQVSIINRVYQKINIDMYNVLLLKRIINNIYNCLRSFFIFLVQIPAFLDRSQSES